MTDSFWRAPRRLRRMLEDGEITVTGYALVHYVGESHHGDDEGIVTTQDALAAIFGVSKKTISRTLARLVELRLVEHDLTAGRATFRTTLGPIARVKADAGTAPRTRPRTSDTAPTSEATSEVMSEPESEPVSEVASDTPTQQQAREPAWLSGGAPDGTSDTPPTAETDNKSETENESDTQNSASVCCADVADAPPREPGITLGHDVEQALHQLIAEVQAQGDGDPQTRTTFRRLVAAYELTAHQIEYATRRLHRHAPDRPAAYAHGILTNIGNGYGGPTP